MVELPEGFCKPAGSRVYIPDSPPGLTSSTDHFCTVKLENFCPENQWCPFLKTPQSAIQK